MPLAAALVFGTVPAAASAAETYAPISGSGSTWSQNALDRWRRDVATGSGMLRNTPMPPESDRADSTPGSPGVGLTATVIASERFELRAPIVASVELGTARRGDVTAPVSLGAFTVVDDRADLRGWDLQADVSDFAGPSGAGGTMSSSALGFAPTSNGLPTGLSLGAAQTAGSAMYPVVAVRSAPGSSTGEEGVTLDAALTFKAPAIAPSGDYHSTLTLTLISR